MRFHPILDTLTKGSKLRLFLPKIVPKAFHALATGHSGEHVTCSLQLQHDAAKHEVENSFKKCRGHQENVFQHQIVFSRPHEAALRQTLYKMIPKIVQPMENKSKERKWRMKAVKVKQGMRGHSRHLGCSTTHGLIRFENGAMFCHFCRKSKKTFH